VSDMSVATWQNLQRFILKTVYRTRVIGMEQVPARDGVILACNHLGLVDGPLLFLATRRPLRVLTKHEMFHGAFAFVFKAVAAIPIDWKGSDRTALSTARNALRAGEAVGIFPEGTRCTGSYQWIRDGIAYLVAHEMVPVVPVAVLGTRPTGKSKSWITRPGLPTALVVGEPIPAEAVVKPGESARNRHDLEVIGERIRQKLASHTAKSVEITGIALPVDDVSEAREAIR